MRPVYLLAIMLFCGLAACSWATGTEASLPASLATSMASSTTAIPYKQASAADADLFSRMLGALLMIALIALAAVWALRHRWPAALGTAKGQKPVLRVLQRTRVSATNSLVVAVYRDEELLLAEGPQGLQLLERQKVEQA